MSNPRDVAAAGVHPNTGSRGGAPRTRIPAAAAVLIAVALAATSAGARTRPNIAGGSILAPDGPRAAAASATRGAMPLAQTPPHAAFVNAPLPAGAEQVDSTYYDLQDFGSLGSRIVVAPDGTVHVTYEKDFCELGGGCPPNPNAPEPYPYRSMGYAYRRNGAWTHVGKVQDTRLNCAQCVPDHLGGFGTIQLAPGGAAVVAQHMNEDGCARRGDMYLEDGAGASTWRGYLTPIPGSSDPPYLEFPQVAVRPNGAYTLLAESPLTGDYSSTQAFRVSYLAAAGTPFTCPLGWQFGAWVAPYTNAMFRTGHPAYPSIAVSSTGRVGIAVGDFGGNVYLIESSDGTFAPATVTTRNLTNYSDASITASDSTSTQYRPFINCALAYNDTTPHVVWSELQARRVSGSLEYHDWRSRIVHWDPVRGIEVVKQVQPGEADHYNDVDQGLAGPLAGLNFISVDWPQVGFSGDGVETYVAWARFTDAEVDPTANEGLSGICTGTGFADVAASLTRPGEGWSPPQDVTNTPQTDERFFALATRNYGGKLHLVFQASATNQAGDVIFGDRGTNSPILLRRIGYLEAPLAASLVAAPDPGARLTATSMIATPNPASAGVRFALLGGRAPDATAAVDVYGIDGRRVAHLPLGRAGAFEWNGRDARGARAHAGIYFARLTGGAVARPVRFTLLP